jgi:hypothetical protein
LDKAIRLWFAATACAFITAQQPAHAQGLRDPMRPPPQLDDDAAVPSRAPASSNALQGVITSPQRKLAIIDGAVVAEGAPVRGARLDGITDSSAVLRKNGGQDVMLMHPGIDKKRRQ